MPISMFWVKTERSYACASSATSASDHDGGDREHEGNKARDDRAEDEQEDDERDRSAEEELARLPDPPAMRRPRRRPPSFRRSPPPHIPLVVEPLNRRDHAIHVVFTVATEPKEEDIQVPVLRHEASLVDVGDDHGRTRRTQFVRECCDARAS